MLKGQQSLAGDQIKMWPLLLSLAGIVIISQAQAGILQDGIIGGKEARAHSRPYMAYITFENERTFGKCGGFLVRQDFILTAAHCNGSHMIITLGAHDIGIKEKSQQVVQVLRHIPHPEYNKKNLRNDIMLLKLKSKVKLNRYVQTLPLPPGSRSVKAGDICSVAGWGRSDPNSKKTEDKLQEVNVKVIDGGSCKKELPMIVEKSVICTGDRSDNKAPFQGDSGGPLICKKVLQGIVSGGHHRGWNPRVYTKVSQYKQWIKNEMNKHY